MRLRYSTAELLIKTTGSLITLIAIVLGVKAAVLATGETIWERAGWAAVAIALGSAVLGITWYLPIKRLRKP